MAAVQSSILERRLALTDERLSEMTGHIAESLAGSEPYKGLTAALQDGEVVVKKDEKELARLKAVARHDAEFVRIGNKGLTGFEKQHGASFVWRDARASDEQFEATLQKELKAFLDGYRKTLAAREHELGEAADKVAQKIAALLTTALADYHRSADETRVVFRHKKKPFHIAVSKQGSLFWARFHGLRSSFSVELPLDFSDAQLDSAVQTFESQVNLGDERAQPLGFEELYALLQRKFGALCKAKEENLEAARRIFFFTNTEEVEQQPDAPEGAQLPITPCWFEQVTGVHFALADFPYFMLQAKIKNYPDNYYEYYVRLENRMVMLAKVENILEQLAQEQKKIFALLSVGNPRAEEYTLEEVTEIVLQIARRHVTIPGPHASDPRRFDSADGQFRLEVRQDEGKNVLVELTRLPSRAQPKPRVDQQLVHLDKVNDIELLKFNVEAFFASR